MTEQESELRTRQSLLLRLRDPHDSEAWQLFTGIYAPLVYRYCRRQGLQEADAADVAQEVLVQVTRSITTFEYDPNRGRFRDWFGVVARSKLTNFLQGRARTPQAAGGMDTANLLINLAAPEADNEWTAAFKAHVVEVSLERIRPNFDPLNWRAFEMTWLEDRPAPEVAKALGIPPAAVYVAKSRVLKRLREEVLTLAEDMPHLFTPADSVSEP